LLFADASGVSLHKFRTDIATYVRLLGFGLPLTIGLGTLAAITLLDLDPWIALLVGAALAPTDAALGAPVMANPKVPAHTRRTLNVESGLNDGIATPVVLVAIAGIASDAGIDGVEGPGRAVVSLLVGVLVGIVLGALGGILTRKARGRGWLSEDMAGPAVLALALMTYTGANLVDANGFVAAFVGGLVFGGFAGPGRDGEIAYVEQTGSLTSMLSWLAFGALTLPVLGEWLQWRVALYAVLSLTVIRMLPVALSLLGTGTSRSEMAFIGWFGPRGLASIIFTLIALESLEHVADEAVAVISLTVVLSVLAHGLSAVPLANWFGEQQSPSRAIPPQPPDAPRG
jgi:NhaP-type Na+/H+ or K+/H+ antiporter